MYLTLLSRSFVARLVVLYLDKDDIHFARLSESSTFSPIPISILKDLPI